MARHVRRLALIAAGLATLLTLTSCGSEEPAGTGTGEGSSERIELVFEGGEAPPTERVPVEAGAEVEIVIKSDEAGELHVHSDPEQTLTYGSGTTTVKVTVDEPGIVDIERHDPPALVLQLEVS